MSPGYGASYSDSLSALNYLTNRRTQRYLEDRTTTAALPALVSRAQITDAHFVAAAQQGGLKLATLDDALCRLPWAEGIAVNPLVAA